MSSPQFGSSAQYSPERHQAGHFEHVAHMNMFDDNLPLCRILPKICLMGLSAEEDEETAVLRDKKINAPVPADPASLEKDDGAKLLNVIREDLQLSDSENSDSGLPPGSRLRKAKKKKGQAMKNKPQTEDGTNSEDAAWARAKERVEQFLDFPAVISALALRNRTETDGPPHTSAHHGNGHMAQGEPASIPNTRRNAVFLRTNQKAARALQAPQSRTGEPQGNGKKKPSLSKADEGPNSSTEERANIMESEQDGVADR